LPTVTTYSRAAFEAGIVGIKGLIEPWKFNDEEARNYHKTMTNLGTVTDGVWTSMTYTMIASINKMIGAEGMEKLNQKAHDFADGFKGFFATYVSPTLSTTKEEFGWVVDALAKVDEYITKLTGGDTKEGETPSGDSTGRLAKFLREDIWKRRPADAPPPPSIGDDISGAWNWLKKNMSFTSEAHADTLPLGTMPMAGTAKDVAEVDKDSNKLLGDMRDTLQKWDQLREGVTAGGGGTQMASLGPGGGALGATGDNPAGGGGRGASRGGNTSTGGPPGAEGPVSTEDPGAGLQGSDYLAARRASQMKEIENNPQLKLAIAAMVTKEHESDPVAVMESLANRTDYVNSERAKQGLPPVSLQQMLMGKPGGKSFYGPIRSGQLPGAMAALQNDPKRLQRIYDAMGQVYAGSNVLQGATDQGSGNDPNVAWGGGKVVRHGETYNDFGGGPGGHEGARRYREALQKGVREGKGFPIAGQPNRGAAIDAALRNYYGAGGATGTARVDVDFGDQAAKKPLMSGASPFIPTHVHRAPQAPLAGGSASSYTQYAFE
jgi:hypothetical protein